MWGIQGQWLKAFWLESHFERNIKRTSSADVINAVITIDIFSVVDADREQGLETPVGTEMKGEEEKEMV